MLINLLVNNSTCLLNKGEKLRRGNITTIAFIDNGHAPSIVSPTDDLTNLSEKYSGRLERVLGIKSVYKTKHGIIWNNVQKNSYILIKLQIYFRRCRGDFWGKLKGYFSIKFSTSTFQITIILESNINPEKTSQQIPIKEQLFRKLWGSKNRVGAQLCRYAPLHFKVFHDFETRR